ncbi:hypothetical protein [Yersinia enterocolitica]
MNKLTDQDLRDIEAGAMLTQLQDKLMATELLSLREQLEALKALPPAGETCWSCSKYFTYLQHAECDGFCPHCNAEVELTPPALAVPDVRAIEDNLIELVGLMCDRATNIYEQDAYGQAYCILKYGVLPYLRKQGK